MTKEEQGLSKPQTDKYMGNYGSDHCFYFPHIINLNNKQQILQTIAKPIMNLPTTLLFISGFLVVCILGAPPQVLTANQGEENDHINHGSLILFYENSSLEPEKISTTTTTCIPVLKVGRIQGLQVCTCTSYIVHCTYSKCNIQQ